MLPDQSFALSGHHAKISDADVLLVIDDRCVRELSGTAGAAAAMPTSPSSASDPDQRPNRHLRIRRRHPSAMADPLDAISCGCCWKRSEKLGWLGRARQFEERARPVGRRSPREEISRVKEDAQADAEKIADLDRPGCRTRFAGDGRQLPDARRDADAEPAAALSADLRSPAPTFRNPGSGGGWGAGAALGAKLGGRTRSGHGDRRRLLHVFGAERLRSRCGRYRAPFMSIIYQNRSYATGTRRPRRSTRTDTL